MSSAVLKKGYDRKAGIREHSNETSSSVELESVLTG
jgi:hypothetical protein